MKATIYHNPRCTKSRQTLELLHEAGCETEVIEYLKNPPNASELRQILQQLKLEPRDLMRKHEDEYRELALDNTNLSDEALIEAMVHHPKLIERPIVVTSKGVAVGRPPENVKKVI